MGVFIDLAGRKFGNLTVVERQGSDQAGHSTWLCECDCGGNAVVRGSDLRRGHISGCGCGMHQFIDETGNRYGRLTVIERAPNHSDFGYTMWRCRCDCGNETIVHGGHLRRGQITGCGCRHPLPEGEAAFNILVARWKSRAKQRGWDYDLTNDQVWELIQQPCHYCGIEPCQEQRVRSGNGSLIYNGLDRVDNSLGYVAGNVVTCCGTCNHAKATLSAEEFKALVCRIYHRWASRSC